MGEDKRKVYLGSMKKALDVRPVGWQDGKDGKDGYYVTERKDKSNERQEKGWYKSSQPTMDDLLKFKTDSKNYLSNDKHMKSIIR